MRLLTWKALLGLIIFDLKGLGRNFAKMHRFVSSRQVSHRSVSTDVVSKVCEALNYACALYPKRVLCLQRSVVATSLLRSHGVAAHMLMGAQKVPFKAHAWVEVDGYPINERTPVQEIYNVWECC